MRSSYLIRSKSRLLPSLLLLLFCAAKSEFAHAESDSARVARLFMWASDGNVRHRDFVAPAKDSLGMMGAKAAPWLAKKLYTTDARERLTLAEVFEKIGTAGTEAILPYLEAKGEDAPRNAARCLERVKDTASVIPLLAQMDHPEYSVRSQVATALGKTADARACDSLVAHLIHDLDSDVRKSCAVALGTTGCQKVGPALLRALNDEFFGVRQSAAKSLAQADSLLFGRRYGLFIHAFASDTGGDLTKIMMHGLAVSMGLSSTRDARGELKKDLNNPDPLMRGFAVEGLSMTQPLESVGNIAKLKKVETDPFVLAQIARFEQIVLEKKNAESKPK